MKSPFKNQLSSSSLLGIGTAGYVAVSGLTSYTSSYRRRFMETLLPQNTVPTESGRFGFRTNPSTTSTGISGLKFFLNKSKARV
jgi:hypothetical protein